MDELLGRARPARIAFPRLVCMYIARETTQQTLEDIADAFNRTHATILHAHRTIASYLSIYPEIEQSVNYLTNGAGEVDAPPAYMPYQNCNDTNK